MGLKGKISVLVVDDSAVVRQTLQQILQSDPQIGEVVTASDPYVATEKLESFLPDVITLDVEMPRMDGLTFLKKLMSQHPIPVVMCSSLTVDNSETFMKALEYGAVEIIQKPSMGTKQFLEEAKTRICDTVKAAASVNMKTYRARYKPMHVAPKLTADVILAKGNESTKAMAKTTEKVVLVGASTGGTEALRIFLEMFPEDSPGIVVVQHMPENFTKSFAERLDSLCRITVKEGENGDTVLPGRAIIAPGNRHILIKRSGARYYVEIKDGPLVSRHRPSVDVLFRSGARYVGPNAIGVIMTGMGDDGAKGLLEMKENGAYTIAQDEATSVVFGMPKVAIQIGAVHDIAPLEKICQLIMGAYRGK